MNETLRVITDTVSVTALVTIGLYHLLAWLGRGKQEAEKTDLYFSLFTFSLTLYVYFDNTLPLLYMNPLSAALITTPGVAAASLLITVSCLFLLQDVLRIHYRYRKWILVSGILGLASFLLSPLTWFFGYEWYMYFMDKPAIILYLIIFIFNFFIFFKSLRGFDFKKDRLNFLIFILTALIIVILFVYRILVAININNLYLNKTIFMLAVIMLFPVLLTSKANREFLELTLLKENLRHREKRETETQLGNLTRYCENKKINNKESLVMVGLMKGLEYKEIADELGLSLSGVKKRVHCLYLKMDVQNRTELVNRILEIQNLHQPA
jgi:hypothetical protein